MTLNYRQDNRTDAQFKKDIKRRTAKEKFLVELFVKEMEFRGKTIEVFDNGVDNSGKVVSKNVSTAADYRFILDGKEGLYDIKCGPVGTKATFKENNLKSYIKQKANILLFLGTGQIDKDPTKIRYADTRWAIITPKKIERMLDESVVFNFAAFGGKPCIQITRPFFNNYFKLEELTHAKK